MKLNITIIASFMILGATTGCSNSDDMVIYIPEARTLQIRNFNLSEPLVETFHVSITGSEYATASGMEVSSDLTFSLEVNPEKVEEYNSACGTSYTLLPSECYNLPSDGIIKSGNTISDDLVLTIDGNGKLRPFESYLLPISISGVSGNGACDNKQQTLYYLVSGAEDVWNMPLADRSSWNVVSFSSEEASGEGSDNGHAIHAFDGNENTFWHTQWKGDEPQPPHHVVVDMGKEVKMLGFQFITRNHGEGWPQEVTLETSLDGITWVSTGTYSNLPEGGGKEYRSYFPGFKQAKYFRFTITAVYNGKWSTHVAEINAISLAE